MNDAQKRKLKDLLDKKKKSIFIEQWDQEKGKYSKIRKICNYIIENGNENQTLLPLPPLDLAKLVSDLCCYYFLGGEERKLGDPDGFFKPYFSQIGYDFLLFNTWCTESNIKTEGEFLGLILDVWGNLMNLDPNICEKQLPESG